VIVVFYLTGLLLKIRLLSSRGWFWLPAFCRERLICEWGYFVTKSVWPLWRWMTEPLQSEFTRLFCSLSGLTSPPSRFPISLLYNSSRRSFGRIWRVTLQHKNMWYAALKYRQNWSKSKFVTQLARDFLNKQKRKETPWPELQTNYSDRSTAACRRSWCQLLLLEGVEWSARRNPTAVFSVS
jgi:hypothetical protein